MRRCLGALLAWTPVATAVAQVALALLPIVAVGAVHLHGWATQEKRERR